MKLSDLKPAPYNPRRISSDAMAGLTASLAAFGDVAGIVWNRTTGNVVSGHQRLAALKAKHGDALGLKAVKGDPARMIITIPGGEPIGVRIVAWDLPTEKAANVAANNPAVGGEFDETLDALLDEIRADDAELFHDLRLDELLAQDDDGKAGLTDDDAVPDAPKKPVTKPGDLWLLGDHRLLCGDSTKPEDVARVCGGGRPFIMVTDPPYGVEYDPSWRNEAAAAGHIAFAASREGNVANDDRADWTAAYKLFPGIVAYVWHAGRFAADLVVNLHAAEFEIRTQIIWRKPTFAISRGHYHWQHEPCWYAVRSKLGSSKWCGDHSQSTIWDISNRVNNEGKNEHGTQKPIECMLRPIRNHGGAEDDVYDPFCGSGTTIIAAEKLSRRCFGIEIEPKYCDVIVLRWEEFTGKKARRE